MANIALNPWQERWSNEMPTKRTTSRLLDGTFNKKPADCKSLLPMSNVIEFKQLCRWAENLVQVEFAEELADFVFSGDSDSHHCLEDDVDPMRDWQFDPCPICLESDVETVLLGCGHVLCFECLSKLKIHRCPVCRSIMMCDITFRMIMSLFTCSFKNHLLEVSTHRNLTEVESVVADPLCIYTNIDFFLCCPAGDTVDVATVGEDENVDLEFPVYKAAFHEAVHKSGDNIGIVDRYLKNVLRLHYAVPIKLPHIY